MINDFLEYYYKFWVFDNVKIWTSRQLSETYLLHLVIDCHQEWKHSGKTMKLTKINQTFLLIRPTLALTLDWTIRFSYLALEGLFETLGKEWSHLIQYFWCQMMIQIHHGNAPLQILCHPLDSLRLSSQ